jgi:hypothetical protein
MIPSIKENRTIERVAEIYVTVFPIQVPGEPLKAEAILAGQQKDFDNPGRARVMATVETHLAAVPDLVALSNKIVEQTEDIESYRLLKFDNDGIHELDPADFQDVDQLPFNRYREPLWGSC